MPSADTTPLFNALPEALPGFERITRYWDEKHNIYAAKIIQGEYYVTPHGEVIATVLGSCVSACIRDVRTGIGGMNHFMLPSDDRVSDSWKGSPVDVAARYGNVAMERLINAILAHGGNRRYLEVKLFGGGRVLNIRTDIGKANIDFVRGYLHKENIRIASEDLGGEFPRKLVYFPSSGRARVKKLLRMHNDTFILREQHYLEELQKLPAQGGVELFINK